MSLSAKARLRKRLNSFWKLELLNAIVLPAFMVFMSVSTNYPLSLASYLTMIPMCGLLYVGGIYWKAKYTALDKGPEAIWRVMPMISRAKWPLALLSAASLVLVLLLWVKPELAVSRGDRWTATTCGVLAVLEYINYYHRQLQHFDHGADFKRLLGGKGFRKAQLAKDLEIWRRLKRKAG